MVINLKLIISLEKNFFFFFFLVPNSVPFGDQGETDGLEEGRWIVGGSEKVRVSAQTMKNRFLPKLK